MAATTSRDSYQSKATALDETLTCGICYELLLDPIVGSCGHDFCKCCLEQTWKVQRQHGRTVKCPVCRGQFAESFDKLGVCLRLRDMVELLFPDKVAERRAEQDRQAALQRKRSVDRVQQEEVPAPVALGNVGNQARRRLHARRHRRQQPQPQVTPAVAAAAAAAAAGGAFSAAVLSSFAAGAAAAAAPAAATAHAGPSGSQLNPTMLSSFAANAFSAMTAAASQLQQFVHLTPGSSLQAAGGAVQQQQQVRWPILDVQFTMGWFEPGGGVGRSASNRRSRAGRRRRTGR